MINKLITFLGKNINTSEFKEMMEKDFPDFKKFNKESVYVDKKSKIDFRICSLSYYDDTAEVSNKPEDSQFFTSFFVGKDESEIPFGITSKDDEASLLKKKQPTFHDKVTIGGTFLESNCLHYHIDNYKMTVALETDGKKQYGIGFQLRLKGMRF